MSTVGGGTERSRRWSFLHPSNARAGRGRGTTERLDKLPAGTCCYYTRLPLAKEAQEGRCGQCQSAPVAVVSGVPSQPGTWRDQERWGGCNSDSRSATPTPKDTSIKQPNTLPVSQLSSILLPNISILQSTFPASSLARSRRSTKSQITPPTSWLTDSPRWRSSTPAVSLALFGDPLAFLSLPANI